MPLKRVTSATWINSTTAFDPQWENLRSNGIATHQNGQTRSIYVFGDTLFWIGVQRNDNVGDLLKVAVWASFDQGLTWTIQDGFNGPRRIVGDTNILGSWTLSLDGQFIIGAFLNVKAAGSPFFIQRFDMQARLWSGVLSANAPLADEIGTCNVRSDGGIVVTYTPHPASGTNVWVSVSINLTTWTANDAGIASIPLGGNPLILSATAAAPDLLNNTHLFMKNGDAPPVWIYQQINQDGTLGISVALSAVLGSPASAIVLMGNAIVLNGEILLIVQQTLGNVAIVSAPIVAPSNFVSRNALLTTQSLDYEPQICTDGTNLVASLPIHDFTSGWTVLNLMFSGDAIIWTAPLPSLNPASDPMPPNVQNPSGGLPIAIIYNTLPSIFPQKPGLVFLTADVISTIDTAIVTAIFWSSTFAFSSTPVPTKQSNLPTIPLGWPISECCLCEQELSPLKPYPMLRSKSVYAKSPNAG